MEFGGVLGAGGIVLGLPTLTFLFSAYTSNAGWPSTQGGYEGLLAHLLQRNGTQLFHDVVFFWDTNIFFLYCLYWFALAALYLILPSKKVLGCPLPSGERLTYPLNGSLTLAVVLGVTYTFFYAYQPFPGVSITTLLDILPQLTLANIVFSFLLSAFLYVFSFRGPVVLAQGGNSGIPLYDFFIGRELNPRVGGLDLKYFCELRPGLIQWLLLNLACLAKSAGAEGSGGLPSPSVAFVVAAQVYYVLDALMNEESILSTLDVTTDGFGFMLAFGDLAWVPATYALQARFLVQQSSMSPSSNLLLACAVALGAVGMYLFRASNGEKDAFKRDPSSPQFKGMRTIKAKVDAGGGKTRSTLLLADGWWGVSRHVNYLADWLTAVAWSLPCGLASPIPYFYPFYFAILLIHREMRDSHKCAVKYGAAWEEYKKAVPYKIVPGVY